MIVTDASLNALSEEARTLWDAALALARTAGGVSPGQGLSDLPPLLFFTDPARTPEPWITAARLPAGAAVVYRHFGRPDAEATARRLRDVTAGRGVRLLIGLDADLASTVAADGVHLPERARDRAAGLRAQRPDWLVTAAAHPGEAYDHERCFGLDALVLSPVFATGSASTPRPAMGPGGLADAVAASILPVYALGGIDALTVHQLTGARVCGIAGVAAFQSAFGGIRT